MNQCWMCKQPTQGHFIMGYVSGMDSGMSTVSRNRICKDCWDTHIAPKFQELTHLISHGPGCECQDAVH